VRYGKTRRTYTWLSTAVTSQVDQAGNGRRVAANPHVRVEEHDADVRAGEQAVQVVRGLLVLLHLGLELNIDCGQLFVERLQLFLAREKLLVGVLSKRRAYGGMTWINSSKKPC
jgi:hypothetical protein